MLLLIILPFFTSYVVRTVSWQLILSDNGWVVTRPRGRRADRQRRAVTGDEDGGDRGDHLQLPALHGAAAVRVAGEDRPAAHRGGDRPVRQPRTAFRKVTLPLALPGVFAGSLLTFIPQCGDFINAALLGPPKQYMIGNVIQRKFLEDPGLSDGGGVIVMLMTAILIGILVSRACSGPKDAHGGGGG